MQGTTLTWNDFTIYPAGYDIYGNDVILAHAQNHFDGDLLGGLIITLVDVWVLSAPNFTRANVACWTPIDHDPVPPRVTEFLHAYGGFTLAMSKFGQKALENQGIESFYVPHGIDTNLFTPRDRKESRAELNIPEDAFLVSMVAANKGFPPRKGFPEAFRAFKAFSDKHSDALLYLHTEANGHVEGVNTGQLVNALELDGDKLRFVDQYHYHVGLPADYLAKVYSASDVLLNPSYGEGFGIPILESQACGTPVITTNFSAMPELTGSGWVVGGQEFWTQQGSFMSVPRVDELVTALEDSYDKAANFREKAREFALDYDARKVFAECWKPALAEIEAKMQVPVAA